MRQLALGLAVVLLASCSVFLDFGGGGADPDGGPADPDGAAADASPGVVDGLRLPTTDARPDAIPLDASPYCREGGEDVYDPTTSTCYIFMNGPQSRATAVTNCAARSGATLVSITSQHEYDVIYGHMIPSVYWIGFDDRGTEGTFHWLSGEPVTFTHWMAGEPNNGGGTGEDCTVMYGPYDGMFLNFAGQWNDTACADEVWAICELRMP